MENRKLEGDGMIELTATLSFVGFVYFLLMYLLHEWGFCLIVSLLCLYVMGRAIDKGIRK